MKVLLLSEFYAPVITGVSRLVESLSRELAERGLDVTVCTLRHGDSPRYEEEGRLRIHRLQGFFQRLPFMYKDPGWRYHPPMPDRLLIRQLRQVIAAEEPDILHTHGWILYSVAPLKRKVNIPLLTTLHAYELFCPKTFWLNKNALCHQTVSRDCILCGRDHYGLAKSLGCYYGMRTNRHQLRSVDRFTAVSSFVKEANCGALGLRDEDVVTIPNFHSGGSPPDEAPVSNLPQDFILFVGFLWPHKGVDVLIEAYERLDTQTKLVMIGGVHPDYHYKSTENIMVIEKAPHGAVMEAMSRARFVVFPPVWPESFGIVAIEAMSQKKAVIASDVGGLREILVDGESGVLVPPGNADRLSEAMALLLTRPEKASEMGQRGYDAFLKNYSSDVVVPRMVNLYESMIQVGKDNASTTPSE